MITSLRCPQKIVWKNLFFLFWCLDLTGHWLTGCETPVRLPISLSTNRNRKFLHPPGPFEQEDDSDYKKVRFAYRQRHLRERCCKKMIEKSRTGGRCKGGRQATTSRPALPCMQVVSPTPQFDQKQKGTGIHRLKGKIFTLAQRRQNSLFNEVLLYSFTPLLPFLFPPASLPTGQQQGPREDHHRRLKTDRPCFLSISRYSFHLFFPLFLRTYQRNYRLLSKDTGKSFFPSHLS